MMNRSSDEGLFLEHTFFLIKVIKVIKEIKEMNSIASDYKYVSECDNKPIGSDSLKKYRENLYEKVQALSFEEKNIIFAVMCSEYIHEDGSLYSIRELAAELKIESDIVVLAMSDIFRIQRHSKSKSFDE